MNTENNLTDQIFQYRYDHELQARDQITNKVQGSIGIYFVFFTSAIYMLRMVDLDVNLAIITLFYSGIAAWLVLVIAAGYYTWSSITGFEYRTLPKSEDFLNYRLTLEEQNKEIITYNQTYGTNIPPKEPFLSTDKITVKWLAKCADFNYKINEERRVGFTKSVGFLIYSCLPLLFSSILFVFCNMDASSPKKENSNQGTAIAKEVKNLTVQVQKFQPPASQPVETPAK